MYSVFLGGLFGLGAMYLRRWLHDTPVFVAMQQRKALAATLQVNSIATIMLCVGCLIAGVAADRFGVIRTLCAGSVLVALCGWLFYHPVARNPEQLFLLYGLVGLSVGIVGVVPFVTVRAFPAEVRFTGLSFSYNLSYAIFGGLTPIVVTLMMRFSRLHPLGMCWPWWD